MTIIKLQNLHLRKDPYGGYTFDIGNIDVISDFDEGAASIVERVFNSLKNIAAITFGRTNYSINGDTVSAKQIVLNGTAYAEADLVNQLSRKSYREIEGRCR